MTQCKECYCPTDEPDGVCKACKIAELEEQHPELAADQDANYGWAKRAEDQYKACEALKSELLELLNPFIMSPEHTPEEVEIIESAYRTLSEYERDMQRLRDELAVE